MAKIKEHWVKTTPYGDYKKTKDRLSRRTDSITMILREVKALSIMGKHAGSKPLYKILRGLAKAHEAISSAKKADKVDNDAVV